MIHLTWNDIVLYGIPVVFVLGILWGGLIEFVKAQTGQQYDPNQYRS